MWSTLRFALRERARTVFRKESTKSATAAPLGKVPPGNSLIGMSI
jgi:hypothetical protein